MLAVIKHVVDNNIICFAATQLNMNMSCNTTKLKKSSSDWLNSGKAVIQHLSEKMRFSCFRVLPGSAKALVR